MPDKPRDDEQLPPIPDGGLSESMPEWLRRPPAWRTLQDAEVVPPQPALTGALPNADTSEIDPRTFLTDDDLPEWLRRFGDTARPITAPEPTAERQPDVNGGAGDLVAEHAAAPSRFTPRAPVVRSTDERSATTVESGRPAATGASQPPRFARGPIHRAAWWQGPQLAILLAVALIIALIVIAILVI